MSKVPEVIWQKAASQSCHSSAACARQVHSPAAAAEQCAMQSCVDTLQWANTCSIWGDLDPRLKLGSLDPHESAPISIGSAVLHSSPVCQTQRRATCSNRPYLCTACRRCDLKLLTTESFNKKRSFSDFMPLYYRNYLLILRIYVTA